MLSKCQRWVYVHAARLFFFWYERSSIGEKTKQMRGQARLFLAPSHVHTHVHSTLKKLPRPQHPVLHRLWRCLGTSYADCTLIVFLNGGPQLGKQPPIPRATHNRAVHSKQECFPSSSTPGIAQSWPTLQFSVQTKPAESRGAPPSLELHLNFQSSVCRQVPSRRRTL